MGTVMLEKLVSADFENLPDGKLKVSFGDSDILLEIAEVRQLKTSHSRRAAPFSVTLRDPGAARAVPQGIYVYQHPVHGPLSLFTVPIGPDGSGMCYEIILN